MTNITRVPSTVEFVDKMGTDLTIVNSARVSFAKNADKDYSSSEWKKTKFDTSIPILKPKDISLIRYLALHDHWTPFGHASIQLRMKAPVFVARQLVKHCVGAVWNEESRRYIDSDPEFYDMGDFRQKAKNKKQGSADSIVDISSIEKMHSDSGNCVLFPEEVEEESFNTYKTLLGLEVAPEQARAFLPQSAMVNWYWTGSLAFFMRVMNLRLKSDAQKETREVAEQISDIVRELFPVSWYFSVNKTTILSQQSNLEFLKEWNKTENNDLLTNKILLVENELNRLLNPTFD